MGNICNDDFIQIEHSLGTNTVCEPPFWIRFTLRRRMKFLLHVQTVMIH